MNGPHPATMQKRIRSSLSQFLKSWYIFLFQCPFLPELLLSINDFDALKSMYAKGCKRPNAISAEEIEAYIYTFQRNGFTAPINYYRAASMTVPDKAQPKLIDVPTLIIW